MIDELFPFQKQAVSELRSRAAMALGNYRALHIPQVLSLQAPTGSGKTIIMASLIEEVYSGSETHAEQPEAIFVWLSDSPQLNEQSKQKIETRADKIRFDQCVVISDESFDQEMLDDGRIYFLNTQKLGKGGNLGYHSDTRQYTIWETIENTAREKFDRLYFIIDEAHRGMQGRAAGTATTIMQRFIKGSAAHKLSPVPLIIGMSATAARFNALVGDDTSSTLQKIVISPAQVRASGLLKDRIVITYPDDPTKQSDMAVLQAATDEWVNKCQHWKQYTYEQHDTNVNPVLVVQVAAGTGDKISNTDLDDVLAKIEERAGIVFKENEVVHTFGGARTIHMNGLSVPHIEPSEIADDRRIRVVLFKENLSTGWDCPRAETMMSFRHAEDATYIAQLLGRMIRTPLQRRILVDDSLNDVRLFLPYFNKDTVKDVIDELQSAEGGEIPTVIDGESLSDQIYVPWTVHTRKGGSENRKHAPDDPNQVSLYDIYTSFGSGSQSVHDIAAEQPGYSSEIKTDSVSDSKSPMHSGQECAYLDEFSLQGGLQKKKESQEDKDRENKRPMDLEQSDSPAHATAQDGFSSQMQQQTLLQEERDIDREAVIKFINENTFLTYIVRSVRINSYLKSLLSLAGILTQNLIFQEANDLIKDEVTDMIRGYVEDLHKTGKYDALAKQVLEYKLSIQVFDPFGEAVRGYDLSNYFAASESDIDRQLRTVDAKLGGYGFPYVYGRRFYDANDPNSYKIDCTLFAADEDCMKQLNLYAEKRFHELNDKYRKYIVSKSEKCRKQYSDIVANGDIVSKHNLNLPETISAKVEKDGERYYDHLFANENGEAIIKLNGWERGVLLEEQKRDDFVCWLRNQSRQSWSLCIPYEIDNETKAAYPDFIIIRKDSQLGYVMDILEPHNPDFKDNLGKAKGFAEYAEKEPRVGRIQLIRKGNDAAGKERFKRLDLAKGSVRKKVLAAVNNDELDHIFDTDGEYDD